MPVYVPRSLLERLLHFLDSDELGRMTSASHAWIPMVIRFVEEDLQKWDEWRTHSLREDEHLASDSSTFSSSSRDTYDKLFVGSLLQSRGRVGGTLLLMPVAPATACAWCYKPRVFQYRCHNHYQFIIIIIVITIGIIIIITAITIAIIISITSSSRSSGSSRSSNRKYNE